MNEKLKYEVLKDLKLPDADYTDYKRKLKDYIFVNEIGDLKSGTFIRTISIENENYSLMSPCVFCEVRITTDGMSLFCRNMYKPLFFHVNMDKTLIFRKLKFEEKVIAKALKATAITAITAKGDVD